MTQEIREMRVWIFNLDRGEDVVVVTDNLELVIDRFKKRNPERHINSIKPVDASSVVVYLHGELVAKYEARSE